MRFSRRPLAYLGMVEVLAYVLLSAGCSAGGAATPVAATDAPAVAQPAATFAAQVVRVVDGDTVIARIDGTGPKLRVRVVGVDTPESVKPGEGVACFGHEAGNLTKALLPPGTRVTAAYEFDRVDRYQRQLWDIWLPDGRSLETVLAASGVARADPFPPNTEHASVIAAAEATARRAARGLWGACGFAKAFPDEVRRGAGG